MKPEIPAFALLIDADNDTPDIITPIIEEVTRHARITVRRAYGDFTTPHLAGWRETLASHGILPIQQYRNTVGKNATDSALIIDAMDLLHAGRLDGFCLVSSDGDFTRLATRIRENALHVYGFGRKHAPKSFVNACERYIYVENLLPDGNLSSLTRDIRRSEPKPSQPTAPAPVPEVPKLKTLLLRAYANVADEDGWALLSSIALYLRSNHSDFDPRNYGAANFVRLLQSVDGFELARRSQGNGLAHFCRPLRRIMPADYIVALCTAVQSTADADGWAALPAIGNRLRELGKTIEESGCASLREALDASCLFDMRDVDGTRKEFRLTDLEDMAE